MSGYYTNSESGLNEARGLISRMSVEELTELMNKDDKVTQLVQNLPEVCDFLCIDLFVNHS